MKMLSVAPTATSSGRPWRINFTVTNHVFSPPSQGVRLASDKTVLSSAFVLRNLPIETVPSTNTPFQAAFITSSTASSTPTDSNYESRYPSTGVANGSIKKKKKSRNGSPNYSWYEIDALSDIVAEVEPSGGKYWSAVASKYDAYKSLKYRPNIVWLMLFHMVLVRLVSCTEARKWNLPLDKSLRMGLKRSCRTITRQSDS